MNLNQFFEQFSLTFDFEGYRTYCLNLMQQYEEPLIKTYSVARLQQEKISTAALVAAVVHSYYMLSPREKTFFNHLLNDDYRFQMHQMQMLKNFHKDTLLHVLFRYKPDIMIGPKTTAKDVLFEQAQSLEDQEFLHNVLNDNDDKLFQLYQHNPYYHFRLAKILAGPQTIWMIVQQLCCTERRCFKMQRYRRATHTGRQRFEFVDNLAPTCIDLRFSLVDSNFDETRRSLLYKLTNATQSMVVSTSGDVLYESRGKLDWFLFELHASGLRAQLAQRGARLAFILQKRLGVAKHNSDSIVAATLLQENRYSAALLYRHAPCALRAWLLRYHIPIYLPLMIPLDPFGHFMCQSLKVADWPTEIHLDVEYAQRALHNRGEFEHAMLYYEPLVVENVRQRGESWQYSFDTGRAVSCILVCAPWPIRSIGVYCDDIGDGDGTIAFCTGDASFIHVDASKNYWHSVSLKEFTDNRSVLFSTKEGSVSVDPPISFSRLERTNVRIEWRDKMCFSNSSAALVSLYIRCYNLMRRSAGICAKLFL